MLFRFRRLSACFHAFVYEHHAPNSQRSVSRSMCIMYKQQLSAYLKTRVRGRCNEIARKRGLVPIVKEEPQSISIDMDWPSPATSADWRSVDFLTLIFSRMGSAVDTDASAIGSTRSVIVGLARRTLRVLRVRSRADAMLKYLG